jgi:dTDP-4-amino-4,6-dideoxygalactose transaminase
MTRSRPTAVISKAPGLGPFRLRSAGPAPFPFDTTRAVPTHSGRSAIALAGACLRLSPGEKVLLPDYHCGSELDVLVRMGLDSDFYPVGDDLQPDLAAIRAGLDRGARVVYVIHFFGYAQPIHEIAGLAEAAGALVIEDLALGLYSTFETGEPLGTVGDAAIFSLVKTLALPDGGICVAPGPSAPTALPPPPTVPVLRELRALSRNARRRTPRDSFARLDAAERVAWDPGAGAAGHLPPRALSWPSRALLRLQDHDRIVRHRRATYDALHAAVSARRPGDADLRPLLPPRPPGACPSFFPLFAREADAVARELLRHGIEPVHFWRRAHPRSPRVALSDGTSLRDSVLRLPVHHGIGPEEVARIAGAVASAR